jgi:hypothetical protein
MLATLLTLTNLYNIRPTCLQNTLGTRPDDLRRLWVILSILDEEILNNLLTLNLGRSKKAAQAGSSSSP